MSVWYNNSFIGWSSMTISDTVEKIYLYTNNYLVIKFSICNTYLSFTYLTASISSNSQYASVM